MACNPLDAVTESAGGGRVMGHFIEDFSSILSGAACPVAVDDIERKIRYPVSEKLLSFFGKGYSDLVPGYLWEDYPESHHIS